MITVSVSCLAQSEPDSINCEDPQTQLEMNICSLRDYEASDKKLNEIFKEIAASIDAKSKPLLIQAQRNWIIVRDSHCKIYEHFYQGGSMMPMMINSCKKELTDNRIRELHTILEEIKAN